MIPGLKGKSKFRQLLKVFSMRPGDLPPGARGLPPGAGGGAVAFAESVGWRRQMSFSQPPVDVFSFVVVTACP